MKKWFSLSQPSGQPVVEIPLSAIQPSPYQARRNFSAESLHELSVSIQRYGLLQPISVRELGGGAYQLIAGERRVRASRLARRQTIPAILLDVSEEDAALLCMVENLQREELQFFEEAEGYAALIQVHGLTQEQVAEQLGKQQSTIANKLRLLRLPQATREYVVRHNLTERHARALLRLPDDEAQMEVVRKITDGGLNVRQTDQMIADILDAMHQPPKVLSQTRMVCCDWRLLSNSIKTAVNQMREAGVPVGYSFREIDNMVEMRVTLPKSSQRAGKHKASEG